jgi:hypothetical protein
VSSPKAALHPVNPIAELVFFLLFYRKFLLTKKKEDIRVRGNTGGFEEFIYAKEACARVQVIRHWRSAMRST